MDITLILSIVIVLLMLVIVYKLFSSNNSNDFTLLKKDIELLINDKLHQNNLIINESINDFKSASTKQINDLQNDLSFTNNNNHKYLMRLLDTYKENINKQMNDLSTQVDTKFNDHMKQTLLQHTKMNDSIGQSKTELLGLQHTSFKEVNHTLEERLKEITIEMNKKIDKSFEKTNTSFASMLERLARIDEAQKKIDSLSTNIVSLQGVLTDKKTRGMFGEVQLENILKNVFGEPGKLYQKQYTLSNGTKVDACVFVPEPVGNICIDAKFPLENYERMVDSNNDQATTKIFKKAFSDDLKKHIKDISEKYIIKDETADSAIMFLPAEAIFAYVTAYMPEIIEYAHQERVWISSPTTMMATMSSIQVILKNIETSKYTQKIHEELNKLAVEFRRYEERWVELDKNLTSVTKNAKNISITTNKISNKFNDINEIEFAREESDLIE